MTEPMRPPTPRAPAAGLVAMRRAVVGMSALFGLLLSAMAYLGQTLWARRSFADLFSAHLLGGRLAVGAAIGAAAAAAALVVIRRLPGLAGFRRLVREGYEGIEPRVVDLVAIALVAGWSEELFFRGVIQPRVGLWIAALAFALVHGVHRVRSRSGLALALFLFAAGAGLGAVCNWRGLEAAMAAHAAYDLVVLLGLREMLRRGVW
jgi:membrane protease YdiL (CAAX protease family)